MSSRVEDVINKLGTFDYFYVGQSSRIDYLDFPNGMKTNYTYTNDQRVRIVETENSVEQSNQVYVWDGSQIAQKRNGTGSTVERNYFASGFDEGGSDYFYTRDHLGSIREVVATDGTTVEAVYDYSPWGEVSKIAGTGAESDFLYTGHFHHNPSDLHLTLYRAYNPELGMWLSRDWIAESGGINLYTYSFNNPVNYWDLLGLQGSRTYSDAVLKYKAAQRQKVCNAISTGIDYAQYTGARLLEGAAVVGELTTATAYLGTSILGGGLDLLNSAGASDPIGAAGDALWQTGQSLPPALGAEAQATGFGLQLSSELMPHGEGIMNGALSITNQHYRQALSYLNGKFSDPFYPNADVSKSDDCK